MDLSNYIKKFEIPKQAPPRSSIIYLICEKVKINEDELKNRIIISKLVKPLKDHELYSFYKLCKCGSPTDSTDFKGMFLKEVKTIKRVKKPKQQKLL